MKNLWLSVGLCAICQEPISPNWIGGPQLGSKCQKHAEIDVFRPEHFQLTHTKQLVFNPLRGVCKYQTNWRGTRLKINNRACIITAQESTWSWFQHLNGSAEQQLYGLTDDILRKLFVENGGSLQPWAVSYRYHPTRLDPTGPVTLVMTHNDAKHHLPASIEIQLAGEVPCYALLHELCDLYTAWVFRLTLSEQLGGGYTGYGFHMASSLSEHRPRVSFTLLSAKDTNRRATAITDAATLWSRLMQLLLQHRWDQYSLETMRDWWDVFCRAQDLLLNIVPRKRLQEFLAFARHANHGSARHFAVKDEPLRRVFLAGTTTGTAWRAHFTQKLLAAGVLLNQINNPHLPPEVEYTQQHMRQERAAKRDDNTTVVVHICAAVPRKGEREQPNRAELLGSISMEEAGQYAFSEPHRTAVVIDPSGFTPGRRPRQVLEDLIEMLQGHFDGQPPYFETLEDAIAWVSGLLLCRQQ